MHNTVYLYEQRKCTKEIKERIIYLKFKFYLFIKNNLSLFYFVFQKIFNSVHIYVMIL